MNILKRSRLERGLTVSALSQRTGITSRTIARAEAGERISELTAFKLGVSLNQDGEEFVEALASKKQAKPEQEQALAG